MGMQKNFGEAAGKQVSIELAVKGILASNNVVPGLNHFYMDFGKKLASLKVAHKAETLQREACIQFNKWSARGLNEGVLDAIVNVFIPGLSCIVVECDYPEVQDVDKGVAYSFGLLVGTLDRGLPWTGQTGVYVAGDDGTYQKGHTTDRPIPGSRFTDNGDGTITDNATGLMWAKDGTGAGCYNGNTITGDGAIVWAEALTFAGYSDWRMPNIKELMSIIDYGRFFFAIDPAFINTQSGPYWVSTSYHGDPSKMWAFYFDDGGLVQDFKDAEYFVRAVRGGKP